MIAKLAIGLTLLATSSLQSPVAKDDDPRSLRGNAVYTKTSMLMARDICSDHSGDTMVWIIDYRSKTWMSVTCEKWALADSKGRE